MQLHGWFSWPASSWSASSWSRKPWSTPAYHDYQGRLPVTPPNQSDDILKTAEDSCVIRLQTLTRRINDLRPAEAKTSLSRSADSMFGLPGSNVSTSRREPMQLLSCPGARPSRQDQSCWSAGRSPRPWMMWVWPKCHTSVVRTLGKGEQSRSM